MFLPPSNQYPNYTDSSELVGPRILDEKVKNSDPNIVDKVMSTNDFTPVNFIGRPLDYTHHPKAIKLNISIKYSPQTTDSESNQRYFFSLLKK